MRIYSCIAIILMGVIISLSPSFAASISDEPGICPEVPKNYNEDIKCFRHAAERGDSYAQNNLGYIFAAGEDVPQNLVEAYAWWTVAAMDGIETARGNADKIRKRMTSSQVEKAQFLAMECFMRAIK